MNCNQFSLTSCMGCPALRGSIPYVGAGSIGWMPSKPNLQCQSTER